MTWPLIIPEEKFVPYCQEVSGAIKKLGSLGFEVRYIPSRLMEELQACPRDFKNVDPSYRLDDMRQVWFQGTPKGWENLPSDNQQLDAAPMTEPRKETE